MLPFLLLVLLAPLAAMAAPTGGDAKTLRRSQREEAVAVFNDLAQQSGLEAVSAPAMMRASSRRISRMCYCMRPRSPGPGLILRGTP